MPPINQQGSRTGLITALVTFVILFVVSLVFAFNYYGKFQQAVKNLEQEQKNYATIINDQQLTGPGVSALTAAKGESPPHFQIVNSPTTTAFDVAQHTIDGLRAVIAGSGNDQPAGATADGAAAALTQAGKDLAEAKVTTVDLNAGGLVGAVKSLTKAVLDGRRDVAAGDKRLADANTQLAAMTKSVADVTAAKDAANAAQATQAKSALDATQQTVDAQKASVDQLTDAAHKAIATNEQTTTDLHGQVDALTRTGQQKDKQIDALRDKLEPTRRYVDDAAIRPVDGKLIRVSGGVCYINLGYGSGVSNGLTFEVYDKLVGVPALPKNETGNEELPVGKASIEVIHVGNDSSECRVVHTEPGVVLSEGDPIANLVFDPRQKYHFFVFGSFDLANTGRPVASDVEVVKRLVTQWGGKLSDHITPETDFVVLGMEPVIPEFSKDDQTPENTQKVADATAALEKYQEVRQEAKDLHIPVLNQNRFLYYVGYYDQATR